MFLFLHSWLFLQQEETSAKQVAERKTTPYPFLIFQGDLDFSASKVHLAAGKIILCTSETSIVEGTLALLATFYVFMYEYPPGFVIFFCIYKMHFADRKWEKAAMIHHTLCKFSTWHKGRHSRGDWSLKKVHETNPLVCAGLKCLTNWTVLIATRTCRAQGAEESYLTVMLAKYSSR